MIVLKAKTVALKRKVSNVAVCVEKKDTKKTFGQRALSAFCPLTSKALSDE